MLPFNQVLCGDAVERLKALPDESVQCCCTSPPFWGLRDYGVAGQLGLEKTPEEYVANLVAVFREVKRALRKDGTLWLNLGDSYAGSMKGEGGTYELSQKQNSNRGSHYGKDSGEKSKFEHGLKLKDLCGIPWRVAFALQADGWWLRSDIIWHKPNPMPESVTDRPTKSHEYIFLLTKSAQYYFDQDAVRVPLSAATLRELRDGYNGSERKQYDGTGAQKPSETKSRIIKNFQAKGQQIHSMHVNRENGDGELPINPSGANLKTVWTITTKPFSGAHFATFPPEIPELCIKAGTKKGDMVLDPFSGSGTTLEVAKRLGRGYIGIELNQKYVTELIEPRLAEINPLFSDQK